MAVLDTAERFGAGSRLLHWTIAALVATAWISGTLRESLPRGPVREAGLSLHVGLGALVLGLALLRLAWRWVNRRPAAPPGTPAWQEWAAAFGHWGLHALTILIPLTGVLDRWAKGRSFALFGVLPVPPLFRPPYRRLWGEAHELLADALLLLLAVHVLAALWHHLVLRDGVLRQMLPERRAG